MCFCHTELCPMIEFYTEDSIKQCAYRRILKDIIPQNRVSFSDTHVNFELPCYKGLFIKSIKYSGVDRCVYFTNGEYHR